MKENSSPPPSPKKLSPVKKEDVPLPNLQESQEQRDLQTLLEGYTNKNIDIVKLTEVDLYAYLLLTYWKKEAGEGKLPFPNDNQHVPHEVSLPVPGYLQLNEREQILMPPEAVQGRLNQVMKLLGCNVPEFTENGEKKYENNPFINNMNPDFPLGTISNGFH